MNPLRFLLIILYAALGSLATDAADGAAAVGVLESDASLETKARACQKLAVVGDASAVPALAELLNGRELAAYARTALEAMEAPEAAEALSAALPSLRGELLIGVVTSLGVKRDHQSVEALAALAQAEDKAVSSAALIALAQIASRDSTHAIRRSMG